MWRSSVASATARNRLGRSLSRSPLSAAPFSGSMSRPTSMSPIYGVHTMFGCILVISTHLYLLIDIHEYTLIDMACKAVQGTGQSRNSEYIHTVTPPLLLS